MTEEVTFVKWDNPSGTSLQKIIDVSYHTLVDIFGPPHSDCDGYKIDAYWCLRFSNGVIATIYNYKDGKNYLGREGKATSRIREWHIGGFDIQAAVEVYEAIAAYYDRHPTRTLTKHS